MRYFLSLLFIFVASNAFAVCSNYSGTYIDPKDSNFEKILIQQTSCSTLVLIGIKNAHRSSEMISTDGDLREYRTPEVGITSYFVSAHTDQGLKEWKSRVNSQGTADRFERTFAKMQGGSIHYSYKIIYKDGQTRLYDSIWKRIE